jgi:hypothetical protein
MQHDITLAFKREGCAAVPVILTGTFYILHSTFHISYSVSLGTNSKKERCGMKWIAGRITIPSLKKHSKMT